MEAYMASDGQQKREAVNAQEAMLIRRRKLSA